MNYELIVDSTISKKNYDLYCVYCGRFITSGYLCIDIDFIEYEITNSLICDDCYNNFGIDCYYV